MYPPEGFKRVYYSICTPLIIISPAFLFSYTAKGFKDLN